MRRGSGSRTRFPVTTIIGLDDHTGEFTFAYADGRYERSRDGTDWELDFEIRYSRA